MERLTFIGIGGATNIDLGGNSCYLKENNNLLIIDTSEGATKKLRDNNAFKDIDNIYIIITHTHYDHIAGLGVLIWYSNFYLNIKPKIIYSDETYKNTLINLLTITGVKDDLYELLNENEIKEFSFSIKMMETPHSPSLQCFGIMFEDNNGKYYYTGDTSDYELVRTLANDESVKLIYSEVATETYDVHIKYDDIKDLNKDKLILMHFDTVDLYNKVIQEGFMTGDKYEFL